MRFRFIMNVIFIIFLFAILFLFAMFQGGFTAWFLFFGCLPIFVFQLALLFYPVKNWDVTRELSHQKLKAGDQTIVNIVIRRKFPFPLYYCIVEDEFPKSLNKRDVRQEKYKKMTNPAVFNINRHEKNIVFPWFKRQFTITYPLTELPRGEHVLSKVRIRTGDVFGFIKKEHVFQVQSVLTVFPNKRRLRMNEQARSLEQGSISTQDLNLKNTNIASGIREYMPGDRFSWIDWKQTARKNTIMTKEFEQEKSTDTLIILDCSSYQGLNELAFEATVEISVSLIAMLKKRATNVGLLTIAGEETAFFPVKQHFKKDETIERHLTKISPSGSKNFSHILKEERHRFNNQQLIIILTTRLDEPLKEILKQMRLQRKRVSLLLIRAKEQISQEDQSTIQYLTQNGINVNLLTENALIKDVIEVNQL